MDMKAATATFQTSKKPIAYQISRLQPARTSLLQRKCACGGAPGADGECEECRKKPLQRKTPLAGADSQHSGFNTQQRSDVPPIVYEVLRSPGQPLNPATRAFMEPRFGHDFSSVRVHASERAARSAHVVNALAYTVGRDVVFGTGQYVPASHAGARLLAHELAHVVQQDASDPIASDLELASDSSPQERQAEAAADAILASRSPGPPVRSGLIVQRRAAPFIKKVTVHLTPSQSADLEWEGTPPADAPGIDHFTVSTGKGYSDPGDPAGTCTRSCCSDPMTQCAPPWNQPGKVGACCTYYGNNFWTGTPLEEHNTWKWWTPIQPYYSSRGIALHAHPEVTGEPIGHGCVRMDEPNAKRIHDFSNGQRTNVTIDGRAAPVACEADRRCGASGGGARGELGEGTEETQIAMETQAVGGLEGVMS